jgi:hypothetical protein
MSLDWANERYIRVYTRDTDEWLVLPWQSRAVWPLIMRKVDRSGVLPAKLGARGVAVLVGLPLEVVEPGIAGLLEDGCLVARDGGYVIPNFIDAQEASSSDAQRKRDSRERRLAVSLGQTVTACDQQVTNRDQESQSVTTGHDRSQPVTPCLAVLSRAEPSRAEPEREREPSPSAQGALPAVPAPEAPKAKAERKAPSRPLPDDWAPSAAHVALAAQLAISVAVEADKMRDWAQAKGERKVDWEAAFRAWLKRSAESRAGPMRASQRGGRELTGLDALMHQLEEERRR